MKCIYKLMNKYTGYEEEHILPEEREGLANDMGSYFDSKIVGIRNEIESRQQAVDPSELTSLPQAQICSSSLCSFNQVSEEQLQIIISEVSNKTCALDPIPTNIVKKCSNELNPTIMTIVNTSLKEGLFPSTLKTSIVKPKIKDLKGDPEDFKTTGR